MKELKIGQYTPILIAGLYLATGNYPSLIQQLHLQPLNVREAAEYIREYWHSS